MIIVSILSYFIIEKPFRNQKIITFNLLTKFLLTLFLSIIFLSSVIIFNNGFDKRYKVGNINLDMNYYVTELSEFRKNKLNLKFTSKKRKILVLGDSHGYDTYDALILNENLFNRYELVFNKIDNLEVFLDPKKDDLNYNSLMKQLSQADIVVLSYLWSKNLSNENAKLLNKFADKLKKNYKKLLVISSPEFEIKGRFTLLDLFILKNKKLPEGLEKTELQKKYYNSYVSNKNLININLQLSNLSKFNNFEFLDLSNFICDNVMKTCLFLTNKDEKIMFDDDHYTLSGSKFLGKKISSLYLFD